MQHKLLDESSIKGQNIFLFPTVMCESGFESESGFKAFLAGFGFGFGFRPQKGESIFGFKKKMGGLLPPGAFCYQLDSHPDSDSR